MVLNPPAQNSVHGGDFGILASTIEPTTKRAQWEVHYARFFNFPPCPSSSTAATCSSLRPIYPMKKQRLRGTWVRCSSSNGSVCILSPHHALFGSTLVVFLHETIYEEHYVSQLNFTWPQVSDHAECHIRGSRVIFASYRDNMGQIQKFAMRFSSSAEAQTFMESLKCLKDKWKVGCSDGMSSAVFHHRIAQEPSYVKQSVQCTLQCQTSINQEHLPYSCSQQAMFNNPTEVLDFSLPTSFTALLSECCAETNPGLAEEPTVLCLSHFLKTGSTADYSFIDMLDKIDGIMALLGGDLAL